MNGLLVRSEEFRRHQVIGNPIHQVERFSAWAVDELVYLDITREGVHDLRRDDHKVKGSADVLEIVEAIARSCFVPLTFGGGIRTLEDIRARLARGADKVTINTAAIEDPTFITEAAGAFGSQAIVVSIDALQRPDGWEVMTRWGGARPGSTSSSGRARRSAAEPARSS